MLQVATRAFFATSLYRGSKSMRTAILRNKEARGARSAKRVPQDVQTTEIGQRTKLSGLDRPQQDSQPLSWRAQNKGLQIPVRDLARWSDIIIGYVARRSGTQCKLSVSKNYANLTNCLFPVLFQRPEHVVSTLLSWYVSSYNSLKF